MAYALKYRHGPYISRLVEVTEDNQLYLERHDQISGEFKLFWSDPVNAVWEVYETSSDSGLVFQTSEEAELMALKLSRLAQYNRGI
jgi:hypothetical protein